MSALTELIDETYPVSGHLVEPLCAYDAGAVATGCRLNPALLLMLGLEVEAGCLWSPGFLLLHLCHRPKRLLEYLGYPGDFLGLLAKLRDGWLLKYHGLQMALTLFSQPPTARLLRHLPRLTEDVLLLASRWPDLVVKHPTLLRLGVEHPVMEDLAAIETALQLLDKPGWPVISGSVSIDWLRQYRCRLERELLEQGIEPDVSFPPYAGRKPEGWTQVGSLVDLYELSIEMSNCIMMYQPNLTAGQAYLFLNRLLFKQPCCCLVFKVRDQCWVRDFGFPGNRRIRSAERRLVLKDFQSVGIMLS